MTGTLWHYTCAHTWEALGDSGTLTPPWWQLHSVPQAMPREAIALLGLVWATDMDPPERHALGLTSATLRCDRMSHRYAVDAEYFIRWGAMRHRLPRRLVDELELTAGAQPGRWWVTDTPVPGAHHDPTYGQV